MIADSADSDDMPYVGNMSSEFALHKGIIVYDVFLCFCHFPIRRGT